MKVASLQLDSAHGHAKGEALLRCKTALEQKDRGDYVGAQETMRPLWKRVAGVRSAQGVLLGGERRDLVEFAVSLQTRIDGNHGRDRHVKAIMGLGLIVGVPWRRARRPRTHQQGVHLVQQQVRMRP